MAKAKKLVTPEDSQTVTIPEDEGLDALVWMVKTRTNSSGPLGDFYRNRKYQVPFKVFLELHQHGEAELCQEQ